MSALRLAKGIAGKDGRIFALDTEGRRMSHYASMFDFEVADLLPPFRPERFAEGAEAAEKAGASVLVIDSFSLEWVGEGGVLEWHDELAGDDPRRNMSAWIKPKGAHKQMISSFLQRRIPIVFSMRAEEKVRVGPGGKPEPLGWMPIGDPRFMYELTTMITLDNVNPGVVKYSLPKKIQEQHLALFPDGQHITERAGEMLAAWARGEDFGGQATTTTAAKPKRTPEELAALAKNGADDLIKKVKTAPDADALSGVLSNEAAMRQIEWLAANFPAEHTRLYADVKARRDAFAKGDAPAGSML